MGNVQAPETLGALLSRIERLPANIGAVDALKEAKKTLAQYSKLPASVEQRCVRDLLQDREVYTREIKKSISAAKKDHAAKKTADTAYELGSLYHQLGDYESAAKHFNEAIRRDPGHAHAHNDLAHTMLMQSGMKTTMVKQAERSIDRAQAIDSVIPDNNRQLATDIKTYAGMAKDHGQSYNWKGVIQIKLNDYEAAKRSFRQAIKKHPKGDSQHAEALNNLALACAFTGEFRKALQYAIDAIEENPNLPADNLILATQAAKHCMAQAK